MTSTFLFRWFSPLAAAALLLAPVTVAQAAAPAAAAALTGNAEAGKAAFRKCASCHQVGPSARGGFGPKLTGVIGRKAGATTDYKYSAAMKNANIVWTEQNLAGFLKAPSYFIPGNNMRFWGIGNAQQVADLLAYLRTQ
ncbi:cytochrome c family protein [Janthinobacterium rivuli]|uniref:Cytochrome c family protein n=1 Tax=Janthinobacterium rivuli TaxID=2751478 RepID=A0ABY8HXT0_9BURK|nr:MULTISPECIES: cytochrome c family protein [Janthinobacterium]NVI83878.1 cytochrome c family protein [Janthinobacterium sp. BJB401]PHV33201.1 cytochrome c family protein [Janthinobacterium sp. BJB312]WFR77417.1 cytochrome c family protein [Janthinobacterium rivuli]